MDSKKICFIMCVNDYQYMNEAIYYINRLHVPDDCTVEILSVEDAVSMTSGYNEGMTASDAKYKIYLHQDVFIINQNFIYEILDIFADSTIGMIGMVGSPEMPENGIMWDGPRVGRIYSSNVCSMSDFALPMHEKYMDVEAADGLLLATQYDIPWREDLFDKWDFYDVSQGYEFRRRGYRVVVPYMEVPWCIHDDGFMDLSNYYIQRKKFLDEYKKEMRREGVSNG